MVTFIESYPKAQSCVRVEVDLLGSPSLIICTVSVDVKQHLKKKKKSSIHVAVNPCWE